MIPKNPTCNGAKKTGFMLLKIKILFSICVASHMLNKIVVEQRNSDVKLERSWGIGMRGLFFNALQFQEL